MNASESVTAQPLEFARVEASVSLIGTPPPVGWTEVIEPAALVPRSYFGKRLLDVLTALVVLVLLSPLFIAVALAVVLTSRGPVFYRQTRVGRNGRTFPCIKFRTMVRDAEERLMQLLEASPEVAREYLQTFKLKADPRPTRIGRFLRRSSLDELPQFLNVLVGHMSVVGPRPIVQAELDLYGEHATAYLSVHPGITGAWQVSGRSETTYSERVALDREYVTTQSLRRDLAIMLRTVKVMIRRTGAY